MINGILWDNDGVLVDTERLFFAVNRDLFSEYGILLSEKNFFDWFLNDNCGAWHLLLGQGVKSNEIFKLRAERNRRFSALLNASSDLAIDQIGSVLPRFSAQVPMGIVTSSSREHFDIIHSKLDLERHFRFVLTSDDYIHSKPSPEPYFLGLQALKLPAEQCLVIEDSPRGLQAALAAGILCIVLRNHMTMQHDFDGAHRVVDTVDQLAREIALLL
ncbi:HAD family phosphatase [Massilia sp. H27-R4]|nr:HAD family phosphatase [Massilia sp. H27-R4]MCY0916486.1 HAD family phosphatase [Massilia sp. H27-R4]